tara:strand:+ start:265 stop:1101 length:837 start_codon:yes stop_codon:yes gene_type:complete
MPTKLEIYNIVCDGIFSFTQQKTPDKKQGWLKDRNIIVSNSVLIDMQTFYDYLHDNKGKLCSCSNPLKFNGFSYKRNIPTGGKSYQKFCSKKCLYDWRSKNMIGDKNNFHKVSEQRRKEIGKENGIRLKRMIANGTFTPCVTNSWAKSRCIVQILRNNKIVQIKCRSSWDAYFQIKNPKLKYEKIRVPYIHENKISNYIVDFVDEDKKILYEIKPDSFRETEKNISKFNAANQWCNENNYSFIIIGNKWFKDNYDEAILISQPDEYKMKRLLKQFRMI